jgi:hypothetical protein
MFSLLGVYGDMNTGQIKPIEIVCDFKTLNDLLFEAGKQAEEAIELLAKAINHPTSDTEAIDVSYSGGIHFEDQSLHCRQSMMKVRSVKQ